MNLQCSWCNKSSKNVVNIKALNISAGITYNFRYTEVKVFRTYLRWTFPRNMWYFSDIIEKSVIDIFVVYISCKIDYIFWYPTGLCCNKKVCNIFRKKDYKSGYDWEKCNDIFDVYIFNPIVQNFRYNRKKLCAQKSRGHFCIKWGNLLV